MSNLPTEDRPLRMDPDLTAAVEKILKPYKGADLEKARAAVMTVYRSGASGLFADLVEQYRVAVNEAVEGVPA